MESINLNQESQAYIKSESEFSHAKLKGFFETMLALIKGHNRHLLSFNEVANKLRLKRSVYRGLHDIPIDHIVGSTGRYEDFTRHFLPRSSDKREKERWRTIFTLAVTGRGFPPIDVYKIDQVYFVKDGNHRVSVARELGWETIQAHVTELPSSISLTPDVQSTDLLIKEECADFLEQTRLDKTRPSAKEHIDFSELGGYRSLLDDIELHRYVMTLADAQVSDEERPPVSLPEAAVDWYDKIFLPLIAAVSQSNMVDLFPGRSESDLYRWLIDNQSELREQYQLGRVQLPPQVRQFLEFVEAQ